MEKKNRMVDISSFLLIEGSADSETENEELFKLCKDVIMGCEYVDDDAESCSCESSYRVVFDCEDEEDDGDYQDFDDAGKNQKWRSGKRWVEDDLGGSDEAESKLVSRKMVDQMDDRLFWETCIALGPSNANYNCQKLSHAHGLRLSVKV
ncbi:uncharacterized protein [Euphorbia lathyris]|uniref:uncharacterized protein n=1 Tax=Euphorbia lathyris TaxID=212925 RepID=UPI003313DCA9